MLVAIEKIFSRCSKIWSASTRFIDWGIDLIDDREDKTKKNTRNVGMK